MVICLIVLLVAALNLAALLLARATQRMHELGVRAALGGGRLRIARAAVLDALVLALAGGFGGVALTWLARDAVVAAFADQLPPWLSFPIDLRVLTVTVGGVALRRRHRSRAPDLLLGAQVVLGLVLVAGSVGALGTFVEVSDFDRLHSSGPCSWGPGAGELGSPVRIAGAAESMANHQVPRHSLALGPGYFELNEIPILAGPPHRSRQIAAIRLDSSRPWAARVRVTQSRAARETPSASGE